MNSNQSEEIAMTRRTRAVLTGLAWLTWGALLVSVVYAAEVYVQAKSAQLRDGKTSLSQVLATVTFGQPLQVVQEEKDWLEVRTADGLQGWIFASKTSPTRPAGSASSLARLGQALRQTEAAPVTASTGARGLDKVSQAYANQSGIPQQYQDAVDRMAAYQLSDQEVEGFLQEGRLGEYAN
jgi:uncharacterized protein YgiM (DUF1202 family)